MPNPTSPDLVTSCRTKGPIRLAAILAIVAGAGPGLAAPDAPPPRARAVLASTYAPDARAVSRRGAEVRRGAEDCNRS